MVLDGIIGCTLVSDELAWPVPVVTDRWDRIYRSVRRRGRTGGLGKIIGEVRVLVEPILLDRVNFLLVQVQAEVTPLVIFSLLAELDQTDFEIDRLAG